jgi:hypothetical protein
MLDAETTKKLLRQAENIDSAGPTNQTIRTLAKELAGIFYEGNRSPGFRRAFPTLKHYLRGQWVQPDGSIKAYRPGHLHHIALARQRLVQMLGQDSVHENLKWPIYEAILDDRERSMRPGAKKLHQAGFDGEYQ